MLPCPLCKKSDQMIYDEDGDHGIVCDLEELYCKRCETSFPLCSTCNELEDTIETMTDVQILYFIGCIGEYYDDHKMLVHPNGDVSEDDFTDDVDIEYIMDPNNNEPIPEEFTSKAIGLYISYFVTPQPGYNETRAQGVCVVGPDGGYPTYWWCPKCKKVSEYSDK